jgi:hypothetical protein
MNLNETIGQTITKVVSVSLADNAEAKADGESQTGTLKIVFPESLTVEDLIQNLCSASSPRVRWQNNQRTKDADKREWSYTVKPVGRSLDPKAAVQAAIASMSDEEKQALIEQLMKSA